MANTAKMMMMMMMLIVVVKNTCLTVTLETKTSVIKIYLALVVNKVHLIA